ncbi:PA1571 family protein [Marinobacter caseinilyticus]|uniref:PA1571 family protein n=1 Tax=Marinobacter caseinilyticus TaxID=2692195 RepID=UPI00140DC9B6|nr:PA1571 family protein [Marinobacter caseinilyticus]
MTELTNMMQERQQSEPWMNGAAIVLSDGREVPITDTMVRKSLDALTHSGPDDQAAAKDA